MQRRTIGRRAVFAFVMTIGFMMGCAEKVEDVNRVQPHYVTKADLDGQWYFRQTIVDRPPQFIYLFTGIEGALEKIRWDIRERQLIAYRVHPAVVGLDDDARLPGADFKGDPVAIYPILSHFDIVREFNTSTGEQSNVISENTSLKPWYEREYMRVDWSANTLPGNVDLGGILAMSPVLNNTQRYYDRDTDVYNPDRLQLSDEFIFFTSNYVVNDGGYACLSGYGYPSAGGWDNCGAVQVKVRSAFAKIDPEDAEQFEPKLYLDRHVLTHDDDDQPIRYVTVTVGPPGNRTMVDMECTEAALARLAPAITERDCRELSWNDFNRFGYFRTERRAYDRRVGAGHDHQRGFFANHHQIWKRTKDDDGQVIPLAEREFRPIVYHVNPNYPNDLKETTKKIGDNWNDVFMKAAMAATGRTAEDIAQQLTDDRDPTAVYLPGDEETGPGKLFQIRENNCSLAGIDNFLFQNPRMRSVFDEATGGELLKAGNLERACSALHYHSIQDGLEQPFEWQQMGDLRRSFVWWVNEDQPNGPLGYGPSSADMETGRILSGNAHVYGAALDQSARSAADIVRALNGDLPVADVLGGQHYLDWIKRGTSVADNPATPTATMQQAISARIGTPSMSGYRGFKDEDGRMDKAAMVRHMRDRLTRTHESDPINVALNREPLNHAAFMDRVKQSPTLMAALLDEQLLKAVGPMFNWEPGDDIPEALSDLVIKMALDPQALSKHHQARFEFYSQRNVYLAEFLDDSVIGQALSMKGMDPEEVFQQVRKEIFEAVMLHEIGHTIGLRHNFKASFDALNYQDEFWRIRETYPEEEWKEQRLPEYRYTSIMDYGSRFNSDTKGLGRYDYAAVKYLYGGHVEVFKDNVPVPGRLDLEMELEDYSKLPELLGGSVNFTERKDSPVSQMKEERRTDVVENARLYAENPDRPAKDYKIDRVVPYYFCTDSFNGDLKCKTWDEGANITESVQAAIQRYWNYFIFNNYRRGRDEWGFINGFFGRQGRLLDYLIFPWQFYSFYDGYDVGLRDDLLKASMLGVNFVNQVMGTPEPGLYCQGTPNLFLPADLFSRGAQNNCADTSTGIDLGLGQGRELFLRFSNDHVFRREYLGSYYDKSTFLRAFFINSTRFFKVLDYSDERRFLINYYRTFREEMLKVMRDVVMGALLNFSILNNQYQFIQDSIYGHVVETAASADGGAPIVTGLSPQLLLSPGRFETAQRGVPDSRPQVYTPMPYNLATQVLLYAAWTNSGRYDQQTDFLEYVTVVEEGSGDFREISDEALSFNCPEGLAAGNGGNNPCVTRFTHPMTGQTYRAVQTFDGKSIAFELLKLASQYVESEWLPRKIAYEADPTDDNAAYWHEQTDRQLQEFVEMMDYMRELRSTFDVGNSR